MSSHLNTLDLLTLLIVGPLLNVKIRVIWIVIALDTRGFITGLHLRDLRSIELVDPPKRPQ